MTEKLQLLDLFSGIGGFSLGLERTGGFETAAFCEIEDYPRRVLARHWPEVPIYGDIRELSSARLRADGIRVDAICGGFPCQDISTAGAGAGIEGERSGLWREYARLIGELRPRVVFVENVAALLGRGLDRVLGDLATLGYDAEWHCISASACGAHHHRDRLWIMAYPSRERCGEEGQHSQQSEKWSACGSQVLANTDSAPSQRGGLPSGVYSQHSNPDRSSRLHEILTYALRIRQSRSWLHERSLGSEAREDWQTTKFINGCLAPVWQTEPPLGRVVDGVPGKMDRHRLKALGNAVVPQIPELLGRAYLETLEQ
jgi:DNA (cytosine-5)-methyltransferase 1